MPHGPGSSGDGRRHNERRLAAAWYPPISPPPAAICSIVPRDPFIGTMTQSTPVSLTTFDCSMYFGSSRLMAVSVTIVLIRSRAIIFRKVSGSCHAPRINRPGTTT